MTVMPTGAEVLQSDGLVVELETDKSAYSVGESVHIQAGMNTGTKTRELVMHRLLEDPQQVNEPGNGIAKCALYEICVWLA